MNWLPKGSTPWLVAHELRLAFRGRPTAQRSALIFLGILGALAFGVGLTVAYALRKVEIPITPISALIFDLVLVPVGWLMIIPLGLIAWTSPQGGAAALLGVIASALSAGLIAIWYETPTPRTQFRRRRGGSWVGNLAEFGLSALWASTAGLAATAWWPFALFPALLAIGVLFAVQRPQKTYAETLPGA